MLPTKHWTWIISQKGPFPVSLSPLPGICETCSRFDGGRREGSRWWRTLPSGAGGPWQRCSPGSHPTWPRPSPGHRASVLLPKRPYWPPLTWNKKGGKVKSVREWGADKWRASEQRVVAGGKGDKVGLSEREVEKRDTKLGWTLKRGGRDERDGCNTCGKRGRRGRGGWRNARKGERWSVRETDYDDHILNDVLYINKHHFSFTVIFKAFPLGIYGVSI